MYCFDNFDPIDGEVPSYPFYGLFDLAWKARELLEGMTRDDILWIEAEVDYQIEQARDLFSKANERKQGLVDDDSTGQFDEISEIDALSFAVDIGIRVSKPGEPGYSPVKCAAVLTLMFIARCIDTLKCPEEDLGTADEGPIAARLIPAADDAINAASALGLAYMYERHISIENDLEVEMEERLANFNKERARRAALRKHDATNSAKVFVKTEWIKHRDAYGGNKSAFARDYVKRIHNEFQTTVTEKQMREIWLKDHPSASIPTGLLADR